MNIDEVGSIWDIKMTCRYLNISRGTLMKLPIKRLKIRRRSLYRKEDVDQFINDNLKDVKNDPESK